MSNQFDKKILTELLQDVKKRLGAKAKVYKKNYALTDLVGMDLDEEILDVLGYIALASVRIRELRKTVLLKADQMYWDQLLPQQRTKFLKQLLWRIIVELKRRENGRNKTRRR